MTDDLIGVAADFGFALSLSVVTWVYSIASVFGVLVIRRAFNKEQGNE